ncbi:MAG TPA: signal peptidase II [Solirubrobacterales bacterium]|nr:signal peptidase II [Solirubrobacterales bacterium]
MNRATKLALAVAAVVVALDAATKFLAVQLLSGEGRVDVLGGLFHLELYRNFAGPGGRFEGQVVLISIFTLTAVAALAFVATRVRSASAALAVGLLLGAGIGNGLDRLLRAPGPLEGGVVDWLQPTLDSGIMNLADLAINAAIVVVFVAAVVTWWRDRHRAAAART